MEVIDLISSSSIDIIDDTTTNYNESRRITTPTFNAFRDKWLTLSDKARTPTNTPPRNSPLAPKKKRTRVKLSGIIDLDSVTRDCAAETPRYLSDDSYLLQSRVPKTRSSALPEIELHVSERFIENYAEFMEKATTKGISIVSICSNDKFDIFKWKRKQSGESTDHCLILFEVKDMNILIDGPPSRDIFENMVLELREAAQSIRKEVIIFGGKQVFTKISNDFNKKFRQALSTGEKLSKQTSLMSWCEFENIIWMACFKCEMGVKFLEKTEELYDFVIEYSKSVAWEPFSRKADHVTCCLKPNKKTSSDLRETWRNFLEAISRCTPDVCDAIISHYPTMNSLLSEYGKLDEISGKTLLANIPVSRRLLGPSLSQRIYRVLNLLNPTKIAYIS